MTPPKGNNPELWDKLLMALDEKLQLGLLDRLRKVHTYHFEEDILYLQPLNSEEEEHLTKDTFIQQLQLLAQDAIGIEKVKIKKQI